MYNSIYVYMMYVNICLCIIYVYYECLTARGCDYIYSLSSKLWEIICMSKLWEIMKCGRSFREGHLAFTIISSEH